MKFLEALVYATLVCMLGSIAICSHAQTTTGQISGTVTDASGAAIPGAAVVAKDIDKGLNKTTTTDTRGNYSLLALQTGRYTLDISKEGFKNLQQTGVVIDVNSALQLNLTLTVGSVISSVTVQANAVAVETASTQLGDVIGESTIGTLPLNGRSYTDLLGLQPGVVPISSGTIDPGSRYGGSSGTGNLSINGQREDANGFLINGGSVEEARNNGASLIPNLDSIAEFRVLTSSMDAENGHYSGA